MLADATVAPADIQYPTDIELLNDAREILEKAIRLVWEALPSHEGHMLPYSTKRARKCYLSVAKAKKYRKSLYERVRGELLKCVEQARKQLEVLLEKKPKGVSFPAWLKQRLQVIPLLYEQQKKMYDENTRTVANRMHCLLCSKYGWQCTACQVVKAWRAVTLTAKTVNVFLPY